MTMLKGAKRRFLLAYYSDVIFSNIAQLENRCASRKSHMNTSTRRVEVPYASAVHEQICPEQEDKSLLHLLYT
jgi:hypothetical protein